MANMNVTGGFKPGRMRADERWKHQDEDAETKSKMQRPKKVLRNMEDVVTQEAWGGHTSYRMPPGTGRPRIG